MSGCVAVFDVGKTNIKLVVFDPRREARRRPVASQRARFPPMRTGPISGSTPTAHGASSWLR